MAESELKSSVDSSTLQYQWICFYFLIIYWKTLLCECWCFFSVAESELMFLQRKQKRASWKEWKAGNPSCPRYCPFAKPSLYGFCCYSSQTCHNPGVGALWCPWQLMFTRTGARYLHCLLNIMICGKIACTSPSSIIPLDSTYKTKGKWNCKKFGTATTGQWIKETVWEKEPKSISHWDCTVHCL